MSISNARFRQILREETKRNLSHTRKPLYESIRGRSFLIIENLSVSELSDKMESDEGREEVKKSLWKKFRDSSAVDIGLDLLGLAGGGIAAVLALPTGGTAEIVAMIPDILNAARKISRGDMLGGALSLMCAVPIAGDLFAGVIAAKGITFTGAKVTMATIAKICAFCKKQGEAAKTLRTGSAAIMKVISTNMPEIKQDHHDDIIKIIDAIASGDEKEMIKIAKESGANIDKDVDTSKDNDAVIESRRLRNRKLQIMMGS